MKRMLIDAAHTEETRIVILDGNKIDDFEIETQGKQQLKGNIYIGHVSRVEPSLQAAFITYGGNRNGFLAFGEVHPQFFAVKPAEKAELLKEVAEAAARRRGADFDDDAETPAPRPSTRSSRASATYAAPEAPSETAEAFAEAVAYAESAPTKPEAGNEHEALTPDEIADAAAAAKAAAMADAAESGAQPAKEGRTRRRPQTRQPRRAPTRMESRGRPVRPEARAEAPLPELAGPLTDDDIQSDTRADTRAESPRTKSQPPIHRRYRIQDVLKEGQKILVQVVKEERGSKGAALTTYFSLPGRYTVLMPNTPYAGGISRKITDPAERRQLRDAYAELAVPATMGLIIRTAGVGQPIPQIKHDYENLTNLWNHIIKEFDAHDDIQCVHEDGSVIIRALRDMTSDDIDEIVISGQRAYKVAKDFAKNFMPDTVSMIKQHKDETPIFAQARVEQKLNMLHHTRVTLPSGGYLVINPTEALVSVDINSGRATQERNIEETALKTNLEACDELARQIRLRDLAGLIVVDFIDMEDHRNNRKVENAMRKALRRDRARIQTGNISDFGLMEISRQRLRPSFGESHFIACPHCLGSGLVHSPATAALMVLRKLEEDDVRDADRVIVSSSTPLVLWLLNHKRDVIRSLEERYKYQLHFRADDALHAPDHSIELVSFKADGTETSRTIDVVLREQPELPPELRQRTPRPPRERDERPEQPRREATEKSDKPEKTEPRADDRTESRAEGRSEGRSQGRNGKRADKPSRGPDKSGSAQRRPQRLGDSTPSADVTAEAPAQAPKAKPRSDKPEKKPEAKPEAKLETKKEAKPSAKPAEDQPLAVQKVSVENDDTPAIKAAPRKKVEIRKQADTDRADAPLAVAKVSADSAATQRTKPKEAQEPTKEKGIISRLIGR